MSAEGAAAPPHLTHVDPFGAAHMVNVAHKQPTQRRAVAQAKVLLGPLAQAALQAHLPKGDAFAAARIAGIQAAKRTWELIPLCHLVPLTHCAIDLQQTPWGVLVSAEASTVGVTGVEMEALTAASVAALTLYDMLKSTDRGIRIEGVQLLAKTGGKSGPWHADAQGDGMSGESKGMSSTS